MYNSVALLQRQNYESNIFQNHTKRTALDKLIINSKRPKHQHNIISRSRALDTPLIIKTT